MDIQNLTNKQDEQINNIFIDRFAKLMKLRMAVKRNEGMDNWYDPKECEINDIVTSFISHLTKTNEGDLINIANLCMMLHERDVDIERIEVELKKWTVSLFDLFNYAKRNNEKQHEKTK